MIEKLRLFLNREIPFPKLSRWLDRQTPHFRRQMGSRQGIALMLATACLMLISFVVMEVTYDSSVEYTVNSNAIRQLKAYYAAKCALDISLLRIKIYQSAQSKFGKQLGSQAKILEQIWRFPFAWPPPIGSDLNGVDKDMIQAKLKESLMDASYMATIEDEGSRIDLNDLNSKVEAVRKNARQQILNIFHAKVTDDSEFRTEYGSFNFEELVNNITDWMTSKSSSLNGGDKKSKYADLKSDNFPPNRGFRTLQEMRFVAGMTDVFFEILESRVTIYGMKGINPNLATKEVLRSLDVGITEEIAGAIITRREDQNLGGPFSKAEDFWSFVQQKGARLQAQKPEEQIPLVFESAQNFRIRASGSEGNSAREIYAIVMNLNKTASTLSDINKKAAAAANGQSSDPNGSPPAGAGPQAGTNPNSKQNNPQANQPLPKGPPRIVYWNER